MAASILNGEQFQNEEAAFAYVEALLWPDGPVCPLCGNWDQNRIHKLRGKSTRIGLRKCYECKAQFTVRHGTIFESSHLPLHLWLQIIHLMCASKKGISTNQIQRMLRCSMKTAWFLGHRIREAMKDNEMSPMGGSGTPVEADETFTGAGYDRRSARRSFAAWAKRLLSESKLSCDPGRFSRSNLSRRRCGSGAEESAEKTVTAFLFLASRFHIGFISLRMEPIVATETFAKAETY